MKVGDGNREEPGRKVQQETYRRWLPQGGTGKDEMVG